ncbi:CHAT domain-containing protein [Streptomyces sp. enrichment culture]|uniref:CHAT domain-containing protein n=1 Tax=Streptomyces sp. enrichment culture TaxID=1795815 RepID=UPI003F551492
MPTPHAPLVDSLTKAVQRRDRNAADAAVAALAPYTSALRRQQPPDSSAAHALADALDIVGARSLPGAVELLLAAVENVTSPDSYRVRVLLPFVTRLSDRVREHREPDAMRALVRLTEDIDRIPHDRADIQVITGYHRALARTLWFSLVEGGEAALDRAVEAWRVADRRAEANDSAEPFHLEVLGMLAQSLAMRAEATGRAQDLDEAVAACERALELARRHAPERCPEYEEALARNLLWRYGLREDRRDLDRGVQLAERALEADGDDPDRLRLLGDLLRHLGTATTRQETLRRAVALLRAASAARPRDPHVRASLALTLAELYDLTDDSRMLLESLELQRDAVRDTPHEEPVRVRYLCTLGVGLLQKHQRYGDLPALDEAIGVLREGLAVADPRHPVRPALADALANALEWRSRSRAAAPADLNEAVELQQSVLDGLPEWSPKRAQAAAHLSQILQRAHQADGEEARAAWFGQQVLEEFLRTGTFTPPSDPPPGAEDVARLREAVRLARSALADTPAGDPARAVRLTNLGTALQNLYEATQDPDDRAQAIRVLSAAARNRNANPHVRAIAGRSWGRLAAAAVDWAGAAEGHRTAVLAYAEVGTARLDGDDLMFSLKGYPLLSTRAAATVLRHDGDAAAAMDVLEAGRGVLLARTVEDAGTPAGTRPDVPAVPGTSCSDPAAEAEAGPVVAVNVSEYGCDALLLTAAGASSVPLPDLSAPIVEERAAAFLTALQILGGGDRFDPLDVHAASRYVGRTLAWLWDTVAEPVLTALGLTRASAAGAPLPRLWLMPTAALGFLPLHAAGHHTAGDGRTLIDRAVPSYTVTLRALRHARRAAGSSGARRPLRPLAVCVPRVPGVPELPAAEQEIASLRARITGLRVLSDEEARPDAVRAALAESDWVHFACHATGNLDRPSAGRLHLSGGSLTVADVMGTRTPGAFLAYLSACGTGRPGVDLPDEVIHLSSAFQAAGYPHVISTLWPVGDRAAAGIAEEVYEQLVTAGSDPARALHTAVRRLRDVREGSQPAQWASHIHTGP